MKRDMNLALAILKTLEENKSSQLSEFDIEAALRTAFDVSNRGVGYQLNLLSDANLVRLMGTDWRLTWEGHDFLESATPRQARTQAFEAWQTVIGNSMLDRLSA